MIGGVQTGHVPHHPRVDQEQLQPAYDVLARQVAAGDLPAAVLAVADHEGLVRVGAFAPGRERITPLSHFMIASMTKPIMAAAVMRLVEAGRLDLDEPVQRHLPEFAPLPATSGEPGGETITTRDILRHTAGLLEDWQRMSRERPDAGRTVEEHRRRLELGQLLPCCVCKSAFRLAQPLEVGEDHRRGQQRATAEEVVERDDLDVVAKRSSPSVEKHLDRVGERSCHEIREHRRLRPPASISRPGSETLYSSRGR